MGGVDHGKRVGAYRLIYGFAATKAEPAVEAQSTFVLGRHLEKGAMVAVAAEAVQRLQEEGASETAAALAGHDAQILNRARARPFADALHGADISFGGIEQPRRLGAKAGFATNFTHQIY